VPENRRAFFFLADRLRSATRGGHSRLEHDPEKWIPVFRKDHAQIKEAERDDDS